MNPEIVIIMCFMRANRQAVQSGFARLRFSAGNRKVIRQMPEILRKRIYKPEAFLCSISSKLMQQYKERF
jgi:hypothetical protein